MNQTLWNGIGQINDNLILGSQKEKVRAHFKRQKRNLWVKYGSLAACLCLMVCFSIPLIGNIVGKNEGNISQENHPASLVKGYSVGSVIGNSYGTLNYTAYSDTTVSFTLKKITNEPLHINFTAIRITDEWTENGMKYFHAEELCASTNIFYDDPGRTNLGNVLRLTVNGVSATAVPSEPGTYEVTVDFSAMLGDDIRMEDLFSVTGFGNFIMFKK